MIESIEISDIATYKNLTIASELSKINYFYGANGSGKTTISTIIDEHVDTPGCRLQWKSQAPLKTLVYNRDFVSRNFSNSENLQGIFTLGEDSIEIKNRIKEHKAHLEEIKEDIAKRRKVLDNEDGKLAQLKKLESQFKKECWQAKKKHDKKLNKALTPHMGSEESFKDKVLLESQNNTSTLYHLDVIEKKAETVFSSSTVKEPIFSKVDFSKARHLGENEILATPVIGNKELHVSGLIEKLNNSDWVKQGMKFLERSESNCPFCQQVVNKDLKKVLEEYFDEHFSNSILEIRKLEDSYLEQSQSIAKKIQQILDASGGRINKELLSSELDSLRLRLDDNLKKIREKQEKPSNSFEMIGIDDLEEKINSLIEESNKDSIEHNKLVDNLTSEKEQLKSEVWKHIIEYDLKAEIENYKSEKETLEKAISGLRTGIKKKQDEETITQKEIDKLEAKTTTIQPTITAINGILTSYGFKGFSLKPSTTGDYYTLVREDGTLVKETLSEGEKTFLTFLYFFHLLKGSMQESGVNDNKVVVFDDPISSLDSEVLFIVSSLIKSLYEEVVSGESSIKQLIILTHNVYFHKEVSFDNKRTDKCQRHETFWVVKKKENISYLEKHDHNPVRSSYDLLWAEIRSPNHTKLTIQNTMRRILENYFKIIGNINLDHIIEHFNGRDKLVCKSLLSWINDGSHFSGEDLYVTVDDETVEKQLEIFKAIFKKMDHESHYNMMMGNPS